MQLFLSYLQVDVNVIFALYFLTAIKVAKNYPYALSMIKLAAWNWGQEFIFG